MKNKHFVISDIKFTAHEHHKNKGFFQLVGGNAAVEVSIGMDGRIIQSQPNACWVSIGGNSWVTIEEILNVVNNGAPYKIQYGY